jgi:hypothetical protein
VVRDIALSRVHGIAEETVSDTTPFLTPEVARLYAWWREQGGAATPGSLPLRSAFDIADHARIVPDLFLVEVLPGDQFLMKLEGERVIDLFGINNAGRIVSQEQGVEEYGHALAEYYQGIVEERLCRRCIGNLDLFNQRRSVRFESIDCPLSRDGQRVDFIIGVVVAIREARS